MGTINFQLLQQRLFLSSHTFMMNLEIGRNLDNIEMANITVYVYVRYSISKHILYELCNYK